MVLRLSPIAAGIRTCSRIHITPRQPCIRHSRGIIPGSYRLLSLTATSRRLQDLPQRSLEPRKPVYPPQLQIYDTGIQKTAFIQTFKVTSVVLFIIYSSVFAPYFYHLPDDPYSSVKALGALTVGFLPMATLSYATAPFVNSVMLRLPPTARRTREAMLRYVQTLPKDAELEFITARASGFKKTTVVRLSEMHVLPPRRFGFANFIRVLPAWQKKLDAQKSVFQKVVDVLSETRNKFYVKDDRAASKRSRAPGVWELVAKQIEQNGAGRGK